MRGAKGDSALAELVRERQDLVVEWQRREKMQAAASGQKTTRHSAKTEAENRQRMTAIDKRIAEIDQKLKAEFPDFFALGNPEPLSIEEVQTQLGADEALVVFLDTSRFDPTPEETFIWVVTRTEMRWVRSNLGQEALTRQVKALRCGLDDEEWATPTSARQCADLLGLSQMPDASLPLPFHLGKAQALYEALAGACTADPGRRLLTVAACLFDPTA